MDYDIVEARHVGGFVIWLRFRDGTFGEIDLERELYGPVFEPLRDPAVFSQGRAAKTISRMCRIMRLDCVLLNVRLWTNPSATLPGPQPRAGLVSYGCVTLT